jgi:raffinose/stachyose/melibiose transport system substrate-binding protein
VAAGHSKRLRRSRPADALNPSSAREVQVMAYAFRRLLVMGVVSVLVAAVGASAASSAKPKINPESGSFTMAMNLAYKPSFDILIKNFNNIYPNITVTPTYYSVGGSAPYPTVISTQLTAGNAPDVLWTLGGRTGPQYVQILAPSGYLAPLDGQPWAKWIPPQSKPDYLYKGHLYGSELGETPYSVIAYNKDYFQAHGLTVPTTFDQLINLCKTIKAQGKTPISWGATSIGSSNQADITSLAVSNVFRVDPSWLQKRLAGKVTFEGTAGWHRTLQQALQLQAAGCFSPGFTQENFAQQLPEFASGDAVMLWTVPIGLGTVATLNPNIHFAMFPAPADKAVDTWMVMQPQGGMSINAKASPSAKNAALAFIAFVSREKQARLLCKVNACISPFDVDKSNLPDIYKDLTPWFKAKKIIKIPWTQNPNLTVFTVFQADIQGLFTGQKSIDDVLTDLDKAWDASP